LVNPLACCAKQQKPIRKNVCTYQPIIEIEQATSSHWNSNFNTVIHAGSPKGLQDWWARFKLVIWFSSVVFVFQRPATAQPID